MNVAEVFDDLADANVSDYQANALRAACKMGPDHVRAVSANIERAHFAALKGPAERDYAVMFYERAVRAWLSA